MSCRGLDIRALVLVKERHLAKSRLRGVLLPFQRAMLQDAMLDDVLNALSASAELSGVAICSPDVTHKQAAERHGAEFLVQTGQAAGINAAAAHASAALARKGADLIAIVPGDLPQLDTAEVDAAIRAAVASGGTVVIPDRHGYGTNGLVFTPASMPAFQYGDGSFRRHLASDGVAHTTPMLLRSFANDIDNPEDLRSFLNSDTSSAQGESRTLLRRWLAKGPPTELKQRRQTS